MLNSFLIGFLEVIASGCVTTQSANIMRNYQGIRDMATTGSAQKDCESTEPQITAKIQFVHLKNLSLEEAQNSQLPI